MSRKKHGKGEDDMQQSSDVNVEERFGHAVEEVRNLLDEHERWCAQRCAAAEAAAQGDITRFEEASEQLADARRKLADLEEERERLPFEAYRASMGGDTALESELKARYASIAPEDLEALRRSCGELEAEKNRLGGTARGAEKRAHKNARDAYASVLRSLEEAEGRIDRLKAAVGESRAKLWNGQRRVEEQLNFLRGIEQDERREARAEAAKREEEARHAAGGRGFRG